MELSATRSGTGALDVGDDFWRCRKGGFFSESGRGGDGDVAVGFGEEGVNLGGLLCDGGEGATLEGAFGPGVRGGGDRLRDWL